MKITVFRKTSLLCLAIGVLLAMMVAPSIVYAHTDETLGITEAFGGTSTMDPNDLYGSDSYISPAYDTYIVGAYARLQNLSADTNAKFVVVNGSGLAIITVTDAVAITGSGVYYFNVSSAVLLKASTNVSLSVIVDKQCYILGGDGTNLNYDSSNSYASPSNPTDLTSRSGVGWYGYIVLNVDNPYGAEYEGGGGTPAYEDMTWDELIANFTAFIVPIFVIMLPVILLIMVTRSTDKWIILIGITIGAALGYFFGLVPIWLVFLITIGLIGMAYQSVRGGG